MTEPTLGRVAGLRRFKSPEKRMLDQLVAVADELVLELPDALRSPVSLFNLARLWGRFEALEATCRACHVGMTPAVLERAREIRRLMDEMRRDALGTIAAVGPQERN